MARINSKKIINLLSLNINGKQFNCVPGDVFDTFFIYNLGPTPMTKVGFHIEPSAFVSDINFTYTDDIVNSKAWLLTPYADGTPKIRVKLDTTDITDISSEFDISYDHIGASYNDSATFQRTRAISTKVIVPPLDVDADYRLEFYPLYGNDNTPYGKDWVSRVNEGRNGLATRDVIDTDIIVAGTFVLEDFLNAPYIGDHLYNSQYYNDPARPEDDKMSIQILAVDHPEYNPAKIVAALNNSVLSVYYPTKDFLPEELMYINKQTYNLDKYNYSE